MEQHLDAVDIARFFRGQLSPERAAEVERHLATCRPCAERFASETMGPTEAPSGVEGHLPPSSAPSRPRELSAPSPVLEGRPPERGESVGRYLVLERVGQGGMGIVYAAWDPDLGRRVAIKLLRTDKQHAEGRSVGQARLLREAQAMARVSHPHVISVFDVGTLGENVFVAMEFIDGTTLKKWVKDTPRPWKEVLDAFLAAGQGLAGAHAVGLVHRDFKPDNVLIGKDGRIRVTDFGLARLAEEGAEAPRPQLPSGAPVDEAPDLAQLTQDGHAVGTLMYMSPEQRRGEAPDARADQFSFCVALYWALFGVWPFERQRAAHKDPDYSPGSSHKGTSRPSQRTGEARPVDPTTGAFQPPRDSKVPAAIQQAIMRGLAPDPKDRFPSMEALLARLEYRPRKVRMMAAAAALVLVAGTGAYGWQAHQAAQREALLCTGAEQQLAGIWDAAVRQQVTDALVATGNPTAADVASRVGALLDGYTREWVETSTEACRATRLRGEQTEELLSLRVVCLERRLKDVKAVTGVLASADAEMLAKATDTVSLLPSLKGCSDVATLRQVEPPPDTPQARAEIDRISHEVAQVKALTDAGRYKQAQEVAEPAVKAASALGYRPLEAEALLWQGALMSRSGDPAAAERLLTRAMWAALASRSDAVLVRATSSLVFAVGTDPKRLDEAMRWSELAKAALARMGGNDDLEGDLFNNVGVTYSRQQRNTEALEAFQRSLQFTERALGKEHVRRASILGNIGNVLRKESRYEDAVRTMEEALALRERLSGPKHPMCANLHYSLAQTLLRMESFDKAQHHIQQALDIDIATFGPEHPQVGGTYDVVGQVLLAGKKFKEAQEPYRKALAIKEQKLGKDHVDVSYSALGLAISHVELGEYARAVPLLERVLALTHDPRTRADAAFAMARSLMETEAKKQPQALAFARKARDEYRGVKEMELVAEIDAWIAEQSKPKGSKGATRTARGR